MSHESNVQLQPKWDEELFEAALMEWSPEADAKPIALLSGGYSGAAVLRIDLEQKKKNSELASTDLKSGEYILKLDVNRPREGSEDDEAQRHSLASEWSQEFAAAHIPPLKRYFHFEGRIALLYEIAGKAFTRLMRADLIPLGPLEVRLRSFSKKLLLDFNDRVVLSREQSVGSLMSEWLTRRLDPAQAPGLHALVEAATGNKRSFVQSLHVLANPLALTGEEFTKKLVKVAFRGMLHGDLHLENVFWDRPVDSQHFWLIDFALARNGPLLFDHAYFELSLLLNHFEGLDPARLLSLLDTFRHSPNQFGARFIAPKDEGIRSLIDAFRHGISEWQKAEQELRADGVAEQWCLARVAAGLNWANKRLNEKTKMLAFCYAAHAATEYLEQFHKEDWTEWAKDLDSTQSYRKTVGSPNSISDKVWQNFWDEMSAFASTDYFVLIAGPLGKSDSLASLGQLPWSAVIDFDPNSDTEGLLRCARSNIERTRGFHFFGLTTPSVNMARGVAWMMAGGSSTLGETVPTTLAEWRPLYKHPLRTLAVELRKQSAPATVRILVLPGNTTSNDLLARALEELVDELGRNHRVVVAVDEDNSARWQVPEVSKVLNISIEDIGQRVGAVYGLTSDPKVAMVPGVSGPIALDLEKIRNFEEDFEILHSAILSTDYSEGDDAFWRGGPPTWKDLESRSPVPRDIDKKLIAELHTKLKDNRASKVEFFHTPGAGGSTVSLVAAWALRNQYPTVILRRKSRTIADRAGWLFHLAGLPILLVADAVLTAAEVSDLIHELANDNVRAVILYVQRVSQRSEDKIGVYDPMEPIEAQAFAYSFSQRTGDHERAALLRSVSDPTRKEHVRLRSPFFFGLITYEKDFTHLADYVANHLRQATFPERKLLSFLALVSSFSQMALSSSLARRLINLPSDSRNLMGIGVGPDTARLIVEWDNAVKLVHPLVAEEVLAQQGGGLDKWRLGLSDLCIDFTRQAIQSAGDYTTELEHVFLSLFIARENWSIDDSAGIRSQFSPLLMAIPSDAGRARLLESLTDLCPTNPHFWNHRGRLSAYCESPNFRQAEEFLLKAVELSNGLDSLHHHALGLVRRLWLQSKVREIGAQSTAAKKTKLSSEALFEQIKPLVSSSLAAFAEARKINPESAYGYITAVQTILFIAEELSKTTGERFESLCNESGPVGDWIRSQIASAEQMLARLARIRGYENESSYEITCLTKLARLYGSFELIKTWEGQLDNTSEPEHMRRAIVSLYLAKRQRRWASLEPKELRRIVKLSEDNLRRDPADERDLRSWFQAMRRLPEFNYFEATERLQAWAASGESLDAYYYQYILHYLRWQGQGDEAEEVILKNIKKCIELRMGQRGFSYEWLARAPEWCPLVSAGEVGEWDRQRNFFADSSRLAFASGTIESIKPQSGTIRLGRLLRAFFVPTAEIREVSHLNKDVHFYLGFSYEGFRAWGVKLGPPLVGDEASGVRKVSQPRTPQKLWVGGIPFHFKEIDVRALFEPFGRVELVELPPSPTHSGSNRGFGFVVMGAQAEALNAVQKLNGQRTLFGRRLQVREAEKSG
jgi:hypothetical protein